MATPSKKNTSSKKDKAKTLARSKPTTKTAPAPVKKSGASALSRVKSLARPSLVSTFSGGGGQKLPLRVQALIDKDDIADILYRFARGIDRVDENLLRSVYHPDATIDLGPGVFQGTSGDYIHWVLAVLQQVRESHHMFGNIMAQLDGDVALVESYCHAHFRLDKPTGREDLFVGSRYLDRMERRPSGPAGVWKIVHRKQIIDWVRTEAASDIFYHQNPDALWSYRTKTDPSYQMAQFPGSQSGNKLPSFLGRRYESRSIKL